MTTFTLDTSGAVPLIAPISRALRNYVTWPDLSPFEQECVEALLRDYADKLTTGLGEPLSVGFSDLDPSAIALIRRDCERFNEVRPDDAAMGGGRFWADRQDGWYTYYFPPLTVSLSDEGKVCLRETA